MGNKWNRIWHKQQVSAYIEQYGVYHLYADLLKVMLKETLERMAIEGYRSARPKELESFAEKAIRKHGSCPDPIHQFTDLCGARIVVFAQPEADRVARFIRRNFVIDEDNSEDVRSRLKPDQFGYRAMHYVVQMPWVALLGYGQCRATLEKYSGGADQNVRRFLQRVGDAESDELLQKILAETFITQGNQGAEAIYEAIRTAVPRLMDQEGVEILRLGLTGVLAGGHPDPDGAVGLMCQIGNRKAEIQVQTLLQHAWAGISHDRLYKTNFHPTGEMERQLTRVAALLEEGDDQFSRSITELQAFQLDYGNYLTADQIEEEIIKWQAVALHSHRNQEQPSLKASLTMAEYAKAIERWQDIIQVLEPLESSGDPRVLRLLGLARSRVSRDGREIIARAKEAAPREPAGYYLLAETYCEHSASCESPAATNRQEACAQALALYAQALDGSTLEAPFRSSPSARDPHAFRKYAECLICSGRGHDLCALVTPALEAAWTEACRRCEVHVRAPESLYDMGFLALLLGRPELSLAAYAKAVFLSGKEGAIQEELQVLGRLRDKLNGTGASSPRLKNWDCAITFLRLARIAKLQEMARKAPGKAAQREKQLAARQQELSELQSILEGKKKARAEWEQAVGQAAAAPEARPGPDLRQDQETRLTVEAAEGAVNEALEAVKRDTELREEARKEIAAAKERAEEALKELQGMGLHTAHQEGLGPFAGKAADPVVILVGGCDPSAESQMQSYRSLLLEAFRGFAGVVCSGGTKAGIAAIAGDIQERSPRGVTTIGYLPELEAGQRAGHIPPGVISDSRYTALIPTPGDDFTALEPLQCWTDIIAAGIEPWRVRVLGINGGKIAALEYRMALALDASVAVLERSGREAARLLHNDEWGLAERLIVLPTEVPVVRAYLRFGPMRADDEVAAVARALAPDLHEDYYNLWLTEQRKENSSLFPWTQLDPGLQDSNVQQALFWADHLAQLGYRLEKAGATVAAPVELTDREKERLAEYEHARYLIERFLKGWRYGEKRDNERLYNPTLIGWDKLPESEKIKDRNAVNKLINHFRERGFVIVRDPAPISGSHRATKGVR